MNGQKPYLVAVSVLHLDEFYVTDRWPKEGDKIIMAPEKTLPGGTISNAACVAAALGSKVHFYDVLGPSDNNRMLLKDLETYGVEVEHVNIVDNLPDSKCIIVHTPGDKTILGIIFTAPPTPLTAEQTALFQHASYIFTMMGRQAIFPDPQSTFTDFKNRGAKLALDVEWKVAGPEDAAFLKLANVLFFNQFGFEANRGGKSEEEYFAELLDAGVEIVVVTLGKNGCRVKTKNEDFSLPAYDLKVVDVTGAGDTFNASFLHGLMEGWNIRDTARFAIAAANYCVMHFGARGGAVGEDVVRRFQKEQKG